MKTQLTLKMRVSLYFSMLLLVGIAGLQGVAEAAAVMPDYESLAPLTDKISAPTDVAVDLQGNAYIVETTRGRVTVLSQSGKASGKVITGVDKPISVAVDTTTGNILVGSNTYGSVSVFGPNLQFIRKLGNGNGEFGKPIDIAVDSAGKIYVVDKTGNAINIYNSSGVQIGSIGTPGNADGKIHHPVSIAINENAGEIVILDLQQILDGTTGKMVDGARVQYFDLAGNSLRAYSKYGHNTEQCYDASCNYSGKTIFDIGFGELNKPKKVAVDNSAEGGFYRVYVTDAHFNKVMVYDNFDGFLGAIDSADPLRIPIGIDMSASNRLYVTSLRQRQVEVFGVDAYSAMITTPAAVEFLAMENGSAPAPQTVTISNLGKASISWTSSTPDAWVSLGTTSGTIASADTATFDISVDPTGFAPGTYNGTVAIDAGAGTAENIKVVLKVDPNPIQVSPGTLDFETSVGTTAAGQELVVTTGTATEQLWDVSADQAWITLNKVTGMTPDTVRVYVDAASLDVGTYSGTVTFVNQGGDPAPVDVQVNLVISDATTDPTDPTDPGNGWKNMWSKKWSFTQVLPGTALNGVGGNATENAIAVGDNGTILHFDGKDWLQADAGTTATLNSVWSSMDANSYAVGADGLVFTFDGDAWLQTADTGDNELKDIWGSSETDMFTADEFGDILDSSFTSAINLGVALRSVSGSSEADVYAVGEAGAIFYYDGSSWATMTSNTAEWLNGVWANSADDVVAVGENGTVVHFDGNEWAAMDAATTENLNGVCGFAADDLYAVGDNSLILHYDGNGWESMISDAGVNLNDILCTESGDIVAVGDDGTIILGQVKGKKFDWTRFTQIIVENAKKQKETKDKENK